MLITGSERGRHSRRTAGSKTGGARRAGSAPGTFRYRCVFTSSRPSHVEHAEGSQAQSWRRIAGSPHNEEYEWISNRRLATMEWLPLPLSAEANQAAPSLIILCHNKGVRQGDVTQGLDPGCAFPFATCDLPGRYGGVGEGRSVATN